MSFTSIKADIVQHIASKKHRRFATNNDNFEELDELLFMLQRPLNPLLVATDFPPCDNRHEKDDLCELCDQSLRALCEAESESGSGEMTESEVGTEEEDTQGAEEDGASEAEEEFSEEDDLKASNKVCEFPIRKAITGPQFV